MKLGETDREKYGQGEVLELDLARGMLSDIKRLKVEVGLEWVEFHNLVAGRRSDYALGVALWLVVRRTNEVAWVDFDVAVRDCTAEVVADDPNSSAPDGAKPTSTRPRRTSRASTASSRGRSKG